MSDTELNTLILNATFPLDPAYLLCLYSLAYNMCILVILYREEKKRTESVLQCPQLYSYRLFKVNLGN